MEISNQLKEQVVAKLSKLFSDIEETMSFDHCESDIYIDIDADHWISASCLADVEVTEEHCTTSTDRGLLEWDEMATRDVQVYDLRILDENDEIVPLSESEANRMMDEIERRSAWR